MGCLFVLKFIPFEKSWIVFSIFPVIGLGIFPTGARNLPKCLPTTGISFGSARNIDVPGPDGDFGFGGKCFPKDLNALIYLARENLYRPYLLEEVWRLNEKLRKNKDWLDIPGATSENNNFSKKE